MCHGEQLLIPSGVWYIGILYNNKFRGKHVTIGVEDVGVQWCSTSTLYKAYALGHNGAS